MAQEIALLQKYINDNLFQWECCARGGNRTDNGGCDVTAAENVSLASSTYVSNNTWLFLFPLQNILGMQVMLKTLLGLVSIMLFCGFINFCCRTSNSKPKKIGRAANNQKYYQKTYPVEAMSTTARFSSQKTSQKSSPTLDSRSITSEEIENLTRNPYFRKNPAAILKQAGANEEDIELLVNHPNFNVDPLAALKPSRNLKPSEPSLSAIMEAIRESDTEKEPYLYE